MATFDSFQDQILQYNKPSFTSPRDSEELLRKIRTKFIKSNLDQQTKTWLSKEANTCYENWANAIKFRCSKIFFCLFELNLINTTNWGIDLQELGFDLAEKRHSQVALSNHFLHIFKLLCKINSATKEEIDFLKSEYIKNPNFSDYTIYIVEKHEEDFKNSDFSNLKNLKSLLKDFTYFKLFKIKRSIPHSNLTSQNDSNYFRAHIIEEERNQNSISPIQSHLSWNSDRIFPSWNRQSAPIWKKSTGPSWNKRNR